MKSCNVCENSTYKNQWYHKNNKLYCKKCWNKLVVNPKWHQILNPRRIMFNNKQIYLNENPRTRICSLCRKQGYTHLHHMKYHNDNPLKDTIELCASCHRKEHNS